MDYFVNMKFLWDKEKNELLKKFRNISFEEIVLSIENKQVADLIEHTNKEKYKGQIFILVERNDYIYVVPAIISETGNELILKTIYPRWKYTNKYLRREK